MSGIHRILTSPDLSSSEKHAGRGRASAKVPSVMQAKPFSLRGFISMLMMLCFLMMLVSGMILYVAPRGRVANWLAWTVLNLDRQAWIALHINASLLFLGASVTHFVLNWSRFIGYLKKPAQPRLNMKRELAAALAVGCAVLAATILQLPPISLPIEFRYQLRDQWENSESSVTASSPIDDAVLRPAQAPQE